MMARYSISYVGYSLPTLGEELILRYISGKRPNKVLLSDQEYIELAQRLKRSLPRFKQCKELEIVYSYDQRPGYVPEFEYKDISAHKPEKSPVIYPPIPRPLSYKIPVGVCRIKEIRSEINKVLQKHNIKIKYKFGNKEKRNELYSLLCSILESVYFDLELVVAYRILDTMLK